MVNNLKQNMVRLAEMAKKSKLLPLKMQHPYSYSKWDSIHEPFNVVENILQNDEKEYKALNPILDFTVNNGEPSFIAAIELHPGDCGP